MPLLPPHFIPLHFEAFTNEPPEKFTYPFQYEPHPLALIAVKELQEYLKSKEEWLAECRVGHSNDLLGKMFGVLIVQTQDNDLGYLCAYSGKLGETNQYEQFVPPLFDSLNPEGFYKIEETNITAINKEVSKVEQSQAFQDAKTNWQKLREQRDLEVRHQKEEIKRAKAKRQQLRDDAEQSMSQEELTSFLKELSNQSRRENSNYKLLCKEWREKLDSAQKAFDHIRDNIKDLEKERKTRSHALQQKLFEQYNFLNWNGEVKNVRTIFKEFNDVPPPSGAGECAAPKLFQYAYEHNLKPITMAEFWWGASPKSEVRKHKNFYPACRGKCEPILGHMLKGIDVEPNPVFDIPTDELEVDIVFEDEFLWVVNKPPELLSAPGKLCIDSLYTKMQQLFPEVKEPYLAHRLDMSTSGLLIIAKDPDTYTHLQKQFEYKTIRKKYVAVLDGVVEKKQGEINLPLRVDLDNRPRQLVCYDYGKDALTRYEVAEVKNNKTRIHFFPVTGRTHQLRVHAAHSLGLNAPIVGDDLYGTQGNRLHLHAEEIEFHHPFTKQPMKLMCPAPF